MDRAVKAFSKKREVNKIVFTDGYPGQLPRQDTKDINVLWLVYGNRNFHPCCGKVIDIYEKDLNKMTNLRDNKFDVSNKDDRNNKSNGDNKGDENNKIPENNKGNENNNGNGNGDDEDEMEL